ncbi:MAG: hypothetical protein ACJATN_001118 [Neolewinella sp.]|jgi:hypothetical protein
MVIFYFFVAVNTADNAVLFTNDGPLRIESKAAEIG